MDMTHHKRGTKAVSFIREAVFGVEDGVVSTLGAVIGIAVGTQNQFVVILSGCVVIAVEALSMAGGAFISSKSEQEVIERYLEEERWEIENTPEEEKKELYGFYTARGFTPDEAQMIVNRVSQNKELWLEEMAHHELKVFPGEKEEPTLNALIMGISYVAGGLIPLSAFLFLPLTTAIWVSILMSIVGIFVLGAAVTKLTHRNWVKSGLEMVVIASGAALLGYLVSTGVGALFPLVQ